MFRCQKEGVTHIILSAAQYEEHAEGCESCADHIASARRKKVEDETRNGLTCEYYRDIQTRLVTLGMYLRAELDSDELDEDDLLREHEAVDVHVNGWPSCNDCKAWQDQFDAAEHAALED